MKTTTLTALAVFSGAVLILSSCKKTEPAPAGIIYPIPTTYTFANVDYARSVSLIKMTIELDSLLKAVNAGSTTVVIDGAKAVNMYTNTGNPFADASLNNSETSIASIIADSALYRSYIDSLIKYNNGTAATQGKGGFVTDGSNKIIVGAKGLEYSQAFFKGILGGLFFKETVKLLTEIKEIPAADSVAAQAKWDEAFGYFGIPINYDSTVAYLPSDPGRPLLWGSYLSNPGRPIQAGGTIFSAFIKGRAAIGAGDAATRNAQAEIIMGKWEQLDASVALASLAVASDSGFIAAPATQLHALSDAYGSIISLTYRGTGTKLSAASFDALLAIMNKDFYTLLTQSGFADLITAQNILKGAYNIK